MQCHRTGGWGLRCQPRRHNGLQCRVRAPGVQCQVGQGVQHQPGKGSGDRSETQERRQKQRTGPSHSRKGAGTHRAPTPQSPWDADLKSPGCPTARSSIPWSRVTCTGGRSRGAGPGQRRLVLPDPPSPAAKHRLLSSPSRSRPPQHRLFLCQRRAPRGSPGRAGDLCWPWAASAGDGWAAECAPAHAVSVGPSPR